MPNKLTLALAAAAVVVVGSLPASATTKTVTIPARRFDPERVSIFVGDTVRWVNTDNTKHTVTANSSAIARGESFDSSDNCGPGGLGLFENCLERGDTFTHTFTTPGTFTYHCKRHGSDSAFADCAMCGQVLVKQRTTSSPPPTTPPTSPTTTPSGSLSPTTSGSPTVTPTGATTSPGGVGASPPSDDEGLPTVPVALAAVLVLGGSGFLVYRTLLRRQS